MATALERGTESESCRICHASPSDDDDSKEDLIAPCDCSGSMKWVHNSCLVEWFGTNDSANNNTCSTCNGRLHRRPTSYSRPPLPALREIISVILAFILLVIVPTAARMSLIRSAVNEISGNVEGDGLVCPASTCESIEQLVGFSLHSILLICVHVCLIHFEPFHNLPFTIASSSMLFAGTILGYQSILLADRPGYASACAKTEAAGRMCRLAQFPSLGISDAYKYSMVCTAIEAYSTEVIFVLLVALLWISGLTLIVSKVIKALRLARRQLGFATSPRHIHTPPERMKSNTKIRYNDKEEKKTTEHIATSTDDD